MSWVVLKVVVSSGPQTETPLTLGSRGALEAEKGGAEIGESRVSRNDSTLVEMED